ncbi:MAG: hypothetical protein HZB56_04260 [Deltaproteobacteria bacterium]|nr:hypothetical protein [Deltaproteobacteria bacterium]
MKRALILLTVAALAGCSQKDKISVDEARAAVQSANGIQIAAPGAATPAGAQASTVGDLSGYRGATRTLSVAFNGTVAWSVGLVRLVVAFPPTECKDDTCTWGPWSDALAAVEWKLTVTKVERGHFEYAFAGHLKAQPTAAFVTVMSGTAFPESPLRGHGSFVIDNDAARALGSSDTGRLEATYDNRGGLSIGATFTGLTDGNSGSLGNARYSYAESATQGDLQVAFRNTTADPDATLALHSRWVIPTGEGRGDATFTQGALTYGASECWNGSSQGFRVVYWTSNDPNQPASGSEADCAFTGAQPPSFPAP